jgi:phage terminase small subunit
MAGISAGRRPLSPAIHRLKGTHQPTRHSGFSVPEPPPGRPEAPLPLEGLALAEWDRMVTRLEESGAASKVDDAAVYQYAQLFAETEQAVAEKAEARAAVDRLLESQGDVEKDDLLAFFQELGKMQKLAAGYDNKIRQGRMAIRQYLVEFGLTPAARSRVKLPEKKPVSKVDQFRRVV